MKHDLIVNENFINFIEFMFKDSAQGDTEEEEKMPLNKGIFIHNLTK